MHFCPISVLFFLIYVTTGNAARSKNIAALMQLICFSENSVGSRIGSTQTSFSRRWTILQFGMLWDDCFAVIICCLSCSTTCRGDEIASKSWSAYDLLHFMKRDVKPNTSNAQVDDSIPQMQWLQEFSLKLVDIC